jgi:hypothetical protein
MRLWVRAIERIESLIAANEQWSGRFIVALEIHQLMEIAESLRILADPIEAYAERLLHDARELAADWRYGITRNK